MERFVSDRRVTFALGTAIVVIVALVGLAAGGMPPGELFDGLRGDDGGEPELDLELGTVAVSAVAEGYEQVALAIEHQA